MIAVLGIWSSQPMQLAAVGGLTSLAIGLLISLSDYLRRQNEEHARLLSSLHAPVTLATQPDLFHLHAELSRSLIALAQQSSGQLRELAVIKLFRVAEELRAMSGGKVIYMATETWRKVYEQVLRSPGIECYRSVAYIRTEDYWRDIPGERSMQLNFELVLQGVRIERLLILCDFLWPPAATLPASDIRKWMDRQHVKGVELHLVRESELLHELDLLIDFGIYGQHATGIQEVDLQGRTQRFILDFDPQSVELAQDRWRRLMVYAVSYYDLLVASECT